MDWLAMALSVVGLVLNARRNIWCWPAWILGSSAWLWVFFETSQWAAFSLFSIYQVLNVYGWVNWAREKKAA